VFSAEPSDVFIFGFQICPTDGTQRMDGFCSSGEHSSSSSVSFYICTCYPAAHSFSPCSLKDSSVPNFLGSLIRSTSL